MDMIDTEVSSCLAEGKVFPPGFRFHPTDEELVLYYLKRKMCHRRHRLDVIAETDVYKWEPEELPGISKLRSGDRQWFFISPKDRKYPKGARSNRATRHGYWKATGKDRIILYNSRTIGVKKTLVFYKGRAPTGERTDWVMHEYTMDEEELKRCQSVKDYYALYKVYKKSGAGPKNGEQYGAPFNEEDWADEGFDTNNDLVVPVNDVKQVDATIPVKRQLDGYEEFMNVIASEPISVQPPVLNYGFSLAELLGDVNVLACEEQYNGQASFDIPQSGISHVKFHEPSEVKSTAKSRISQQSNVFGADPEDFLEMDDLIGQEFSVQHAGRPENVSLDEFFDGLEELDVYKDIPELLSQCEAGGQGSSPLYEQRRIVYTPSQTLSFQGIIPLATPGVVYDSNYAKNQTGAGTINNSWKQEEGTDDSWFSSSIWAYVESSIPTNPASAAESALVLNPTFERISSFSKLRTNSITSINSSTRKTGLFCFSLIGILCAILWICSCD